VEINLTSIVWVVVLAIVLATLVEGFVEYILGTLFDKLPKLAGYKWTLMYVSLLVGALLAFYYSIDLIALIANNAGGNMQASWVGNLFSGLIIGRGANYINDFVSRWFAKPAG
jgi:hypothetical protein